MAACCSAVACSQHDEASPPPPPAPVTSAGSGGSEPGLELPTAGGTLNLGPPSATPDPLTLGADCDPSRHIEAVEPALLLRDPVVLNELSLEAVLQQIIRSSEATITPLELLQRLFDTENQASDGVFADVAHCEAVSAALGGSLACPRAEGRLARSEGLFVPGHADYFEPVAVTNRFDLLPNDASTCGEYRIVYAKHSGRTDPTNRLFISVEATLFNDQRTLAACRPVAELWAGLHARSAEEKRADIVKLFFQGVSGLPPVLTAEHLGGGAATCDYVGRCGQVRVAQGMQEPLAFRQFRLARRSAPETSTKIGFEVSATTRALKPGLFDLAAESTLALGFRSWLALSAQGLTEQELNRIDLRTRPNDEALESTVAGPSSPDYMARVIASTEAQQAQFLSSFSGTLSLANAACPPEDPITALHLMKRAAAIGCAGCHAPEPLLGDRELGCGAVWPQSLGVNHIDEEGRVSPALRDVFLPYRARVLETFLQACDSAAILANLHEAPSQLRAECFPAGTLVALKDGTSRGIERIQPGEWVLSFDERTKAVVSARVERVVVRLDADRFVRIDDDLVATDNHPFWQGGRWVRAVDLELGKPLLSLTAATVREVAVGKLALEEGPRVTYNLRVAEQHSYFAGGRLVHDRP